MKTKRPQSPPIPEFKPNNPGIPILKDYSAKVFPKSYWPTWPENKLTSEVTSWMSASKLKQRATSSAFPKMDWVTRTCGDLVSGVKLGFRGAGRLPAEGENLKSFIAAGHRACNTVATWVSQGLVCGPMERSELPDSIRVSPTGSADKPNGKSRVTVDMSWPHLPGNIDIWSSTVPCSPNASIDKSLYHTQSVTSTDVLRTLLREGPLGYVCKVDWSDAYKHIPVAPEDRYLQVFRVGDRYFLDKNLSFGGSTSPPLYDDPAELVTQMSHWEAKVDRNLSLRMLDDLIGAGTWDSVMRLYKASNEVCCFIGVKLADTDDPDKAFSPRQDGTLLGIYYHLPSWTWKLASGKSNKILSLLFDVLENDKVRNDLLKKLLGKLNHYAAVFTSKFERSFLQKCHEELQPNNCMMEITANAKSQAGYWIRIIYAASVHNTIPHYRVITSPSPLELHGDAAGGLSGGYGAVTRLPDGKTFWVMGMWEGTMRTNKKLLGKLTFLEALASLNALLMCPDILRNKHVQVT